MKSQKLNIIGPQVRYSRNQLGLSQNELASKCQLLGWNISRDIIARIEGENRAILDHELIPLAQALKISVRELFPKDLRARF